MTKMIQDYTMEELLDICEELRIDYEYLGEVRERDIPELIMLIDEAILNNGTPEDMSELLNGFISSGEHDIFVE